MSKLPKIFHSDEKIISSNKNTYNTFDSLRIEKEDKEDEEEKTFNREVLINYFNKRINVHLKDGSVLSGILLSKRGDTILLNSGEYINLNDVTDVN